MAKKGEEGRRGGFMDFLSGQRWIKDLERKVEDQLKSARDSFDKNLEKAKKGLNITTKKDLNAIHSKIRALEKRIEKLEGVSKVTTPKSKAPKNKGMDEKETP